MVAIARKTNHNDMSFIMLAGRYTNIIASFYAYIYSSCFTESDISGSNGAGFQHVVIILSPSCSLNKPISKGTWFHDTCLPKTVLLFLVNVGQVTWAQHELNMHFFLEDSLYITYLWRTWRVTGTNSMSRGPWHQPFRPKGATQSVNLGGWTTHIQNMCKSNWIISPKIGV